MTVAEIRTIHGGSRWSFRSLVRHQPLPTAGAIEKLERLFPVLNMAIGHHVLQIHSCVGERKY